MTKEYYFRVARFLFRVLLPMNADIEGLLPSFAGFRCVPEGDEELLFSIDATYALLVEDKDARTIEEMDNDMGRTILKQVPNGYRIELSYQVDSPAHILHADRCFRKVDAHIQWDDVYAGAALCSLLRIIFSQAILQHRAVAIHASAVMLQGKAYLFMGKSGTGKSTHSSLWQKCFPGCELLNDDNPTLRMEGDELVAYGTPWSGKTPCYKNISMPVGGMVRLMQAPENKYATLKDVAAFTALIPGCFAIHSDAILYDALCDTLVDIAECIPVGQLKCLPNEDAAYLCAKSLGIEGGLV